MLFGGRDESTQVRHGTRIVSLAVGSAYDAWHFAVRAVAELLVQGNCAKCELFADIAGPQDWHANAITVWVRDADAFQPRLRIGDMSALWVWDGQYDYLEPQAQAVFAELWPEAGRAPLQGTVVRLAECAGIAITGSWGKAPETRFGPWARIFCAAIDCLEFLEPPKTWVVSTSYREGAGYYIEFRSLAGGAMFALNEGGYIATPDFPDRIPRSLRELDLLTSIRMGVTREALRERILPSLKACTAIVVQGNDQANLRT